MAGGVSREIQHLRTDRITEVQQYKMAGPVRMFYCEGCAPNVTKVFCNDENLLDHSHIPNCSGPPQPNSVCQHNGSVFASTNTSGVCEFEGENHIETKECRDFNICFINNPTSSSPVSPRGLKATEDYTIPIVIGVVVLLLLVIGLVACFRKKILSRRPNLEQKSDPGETKGLKMEQRSGDTERAPPAVPLLDDDTSPSQCDGGV
ncbi:uncharacterized protein LOC127534824 isoform X1 [Acanthochromis polyacanthus]|uniref:uncharacterized protein LOC127534824 isoform X1 n=1 Tax=Acanthochromis polyacanthus TaxID=80966 RepID=UPI0022342FC1|nr:uncharacterized protein LOC127534824 isoform X1 [Acanthochromis polyacanthus]